MYGYFIRKQMKLRFWIPLIFVFLALTNLSAGTNDSIDIYSRPFSLSKLKSGGVPFFTKELCSPDGSVILTINISLGSVSYSVVKNGVDVLLDSPLDIQLSSGSLVSGLICESTSETEINEELVLPYGENAVVSNNCRQILLNLKNSAGFKFALIFRVYNEGVGFRYYFPDKNAVSSIRISNELNQFILARSGVAYQESYNELGFTTANTSSSNIQTLIPLTVVSEPYTICINEAGNDSFARIALRGTANVLQTYILGSSYSVNLPYKMPWRYLLIGDSAEDLYSKKDIIYAFDDENYESSSWNWIKPGTVFRCLNLSTTGAKEAIDFCVDMNISYMMFDAGWYGLGYGQSNEHNSASNPLECILNIDMKAVADYANRRGVGMVLYVNKAAWDNYDNSAMFDLYQSWGIKGLKLGFMDGYSMYGNRKVYEIIKMAAERKMVVNVHDNFRPTGMIFKYPNLLTAEGVRGNEYPATHSGEHTTLIPFTRMFTGATDYTICYLGNDPEYKKPASLLTTRAHQLSMSIILYSPLQHILWYAKPGIYYYPDEVELFSYIPVVWDESKVVCNVTGDYVSMARRSGEDWFLASLSDNSRRTYDVSLDFLDPDADYHVIIYKDKEPTTIEKIVTSLSQMKKNSEVVNNKVQVSLKANGGEVLYFKKADSTSIDFTEGEKLSQLIFSPNPAFDYLYISSPDFTGYSGTVRIWNLSGAKIMEKNFPSIKEMEPINVSNLQRGNYILVVEVNGKKLREIITIK